MEGWREDHRHPVMDIADGHIGRAGEDYEVKLAIALLSGQSGQIQHRLWGRDRVLDFCRAEPLPFKVPADWDQTMAVLHRGAEQGSFYYYHNDFLVYTCKWL